ncbi:spore-associated protein A [Nocardia sp. KC 131]|uniref:spore-associated protein A n=1 Tax=Nocardia arseniciresistens TaxID=3392119 RepID=UPI00398EC5E3
MINAKKSIAVCAAAIGITAGVAVFLPATASAATYAGQCGDGFKVIDSHELKGGTVFLTYNGRTNCVVTVRDKSGAPISMGAAVRQSKDHSQVVVNDDRVFTDFAYAKVEAEDKCIDWGGRIKDDLWEEFGVHCG